MNFLQQLRLGFRSLLLHKLRSALAVLGILIGVTAVIWLVALGEGVSYQAQQQIKNLGATSIIVRSIKPTEELTAQLPANSGLAFLAALAVLAVLMPMIRDEAGLACVTVASITSLLSLSLPMNLGLLLSICIGLVAAVLVHYYGAQRQQGAEEKRS